ncbi:phosphoribosyltransferase [Patescibacteria group bacterium]|nr:phosphoribosyltransferase [Patescibacteria group bacterium]
MLRERYRTQEVDKNLSYRDRYALLKKAFPQAPPITAFIKDTLPFFTKGGQQELVLAHALALKREWSQEFWKRKTDRLNITDEERKDFQVVVIPPNHQKNGDKDFSKKFYADLKNHQLGKYPVAKLIRGERYSQDSFEGPHNIKHFRRAKSIYIVASPLSKGDFADIKFVAQQYLMNGAKEVILVSPFMADQREDKNIAKSKEGKPIKYNGRIIKMMAWMGSLSPFINKIINFEPHSSAAQAIAALYGIPFAPISYEEELVGKISDRLRKTKKRDFDPSKWKVVRPDIGRNLVATRLEERFGIEGVHLSQVRNSDNLVKKANELSEELKKKLIGTNVILYDDEAGTFGTLKNVVKKLVPAKVKSINIFLGHARLQQGWIRNLNWIMEKCRKNNIKLKVYITDSRVPVGSLSRFMAKEKNKGLINMVSIAKKVRNAIEANVAGVDFASETNFKGVNYERAYLQFAKSESKFAGD